MGEIYINYDEVYKKTAELRRSIAADILEKSEHEYQQIQSMLDSMDGAANASLKSAIEANRQKVTITAMTLDKLLSFMSNSAQQIELNEQRMAIDISSGGEK